METYSISTYEIKSIKVIKTVFYCVLLTALCSGIKFIPIHNTFINTLKKGDYFLGGMLKFQLFFLGMPDMLCIFGG